MSVPMECKVGILHIKVSLVMAEINQILEEKKNMVNEKQQHFVKHEMSGIRSQKLIPPPEMN